MTKQSFEFGDICDKNHLVPNLNLIWYKPGLICTLKYGENLGSTGIHCDHRDCPIKTGILSDENHETALKYIKMSALRIYEMMQSGEYAQANGKMTYEDIKPYLPEDHIPLT